jgi:glycosyltransferase involved in cell wall biosynthesis
MGEPELSVVIPCRDASATLRAQLDALACQRADFSWEVVIVDDGSTDGTVALAKSFDDRLELRVVPCASRGLNAARNAGVRAARSELVAICDGDDVVGDGWVAAMRCALADHEYVTGPVELDRLNDPALADSRGRAGAVGLPRFGDAFTYARGCNMGVRRSTLARVGWFDESTRCLDDQELGMRMHLAGVDLQLAPGAVVHYRYRTSAAEIWRQGVFYGMARVPTYLAARRAGLPVPSRCAGWRSWVWLAVHLPDVGRRSGRLVWLWVAANRIGQVQGSLQWRTVFV